MDKVGSELAGALVRAQSTAGGGWYADAATRDAIAGNLRTLGEKINRLRTTERTFVLTGIWSLKEWLTKALILHEGIVGQVAEVGPASWASLLTSTATATVSGAKTAALAVAGAAGAGLGIYLLGFGALVFLVGRR